MTTVVLIFLIGAALGVPIGLGLYGDRSRREGTNYPDSMDEIKAGITVYDVTDGIEINRRPAYPMIRLRMKLQRIQGQFEELGKAAGVAAYDMSKMKP